MRCKQPAAVTLKKESNGRLILECNVTLHIPVDFEMIRRTSIGDIYLTAREKQVLDSLLEGMTNKEISNSLGLGVGTVKFHVSSLLAKMHVRGRHELAALALNQKR
jgi:DNA-binding CsgD family transcriptional regulator